jgi:hypothetical protein
MTVSTASHAPSPERREYALRAMIFVVGAMAAVAIATTTGAWWSTALALAAVAFTLTGIMLSLALLADGETDRDPATGRGRAIALAVVTAVALLLAVTLPGHAGAQAAPAPAAQAQETVREFLTAAVLNDDAYLACQYLTPAEQRRVARLAGRAATCQEAFIAAHPAFAGVRSITQLDALPLRTAVRGDRAVVLAPRPQPAAGPVRFVLRRATRAELDAFHAPQVPWRIAAGATAILRG